MNTVTSLQIREVEVLFRPFFNRKLNLCNRIVMAPLRRNYAPDGIPTAEMLQYYRRRAEREVGLIITEASAVDDPVSAEDNCMPRFYGGAPLRAWKQICRAVHATHCSMAPLLCHVGMARPLHGDIPNPDLLPIGPSGINPHTLELTGEEMSRNRIREVLQAFSSAAAAAVKLGFDAVAIEGAGGYLIEQFLRADTNQRRDIYGGDIAARARFACEAVHAVRRAVGRNFPILFRYSPVYAGFQEKRLAETPHELATLLELLSDSGVDIFDCVSPHHAQPAFPGSSLTPAAWTRLLTGKPVISGGAVGLNMQGGCLPLSFSGVLRMVSAGEIDLVSVGRALLADPAWAEKLHLARESEMIPFTPRVIGRLL